MFTGLIQVDSSGNSESRDYTLASDFYLAPGSYAISAGSGLFGATGDSSASFFNPEVDGSGDYYYIINDGGATGNDTFTRFPNSGSRFFLNGTPVPAVPEPAPLALLVLGLLPMGLSVARRRLTRCG